MNGKDLDKLIEELASEYVLTEPTDAAAMAQVHSKLETIAGCPKAHARLTGAAKGAAAIVEAIILDESKDAEGDFNMLGEIIQGLQQIARGKRDPATIEFPAALALDAQGKPDAPDEDTEQAPDGPAPEADAAVMDMDTDDELVKGFIEESTEHLDAVDEQLLLLESNPDEPEALDAIFRAFHTIKGVAGFLGFGQVQALAHAAEDLLDEMRREHTPPTPEITDTVFQAADALKALITEGAVAGGEATLTKLRERLLKAKEGLSGDAPADAGLAELEEDMADEVPTEAVVPEMEMEPAPTPQAPANEPSSANGGGGASLNAKREVLKVDATRLDSLVDNIGELVIAVSMVSGSLSGGAADEQSLRHLTQVTKITRELQEIGMSLRMVAVRPIFQKMARVVRDLAKKKHKKVKFVTTGEDTELDKNMIDKLGDPLLHMVRNAADHGVEACAEDRVKAGKDPVATVHLSAYHKSGNICIEIADDGRGLDRDAILAKARSLGLVREGQTPSDRELYLLVFHAGFSTSKEVTDVSGRGVGMDVVRRNIEELHGSVDVETVPGKGSTFTIKLPLTLAIIEGMVVRIGSERYVIPTAAIQRTVSLDEQKLNTALQLGEMLQDEGDVIPLFRLNRLFAVGKANDNKHQALAVLVENDGKRTALVVDELLGQEQIVLKSLGQVLRGVSGIAGGAIMPDGRVGLIIDVAGLVRLAHSDNGVADAVAALDA